MYVISIDFKWFRLTGTYLTFTQMSIKFWFYFTFQLIWSILHPISPHAITEVTLMNHKKYLDILLSKASLGMHVLTTYLDSKKWLTFQFFLSRLSIMLKFRSHLRMDYRKKSVLLIITILILDFSLFVGAGTY